MYTFWEGICTGGWVNVLKHTSSFVSAGLSAPVPRGRKGKKVKVPSTMPDPQKADWLAKCNPEVLLHDDGYKKHLKHQCNK